MKKFALSALLSLGCAVASAGLIRNGDFENGKLDGWTSPQQPFGQVELFKVVPGGRNNSSKFHLRSCGDESNSYNKFITLVQDINVMPSPDKKYVFGGFAQAQLRSDGGKYVKIAIREVDANGKTVVYQELPLTLHDSPYVLQEKIFSPAKQTKKLQFYLVQIGLSKDDVIHWDNLFFSEYGNEKAFDPNAKKPAAATVNLTGDGLTAAIDTQSGLLDSLRFGNEIIHPSAADNTVIYIRIDGKTIAFKRSAKEVVKSGNTVTAELLPVDKSIPFKAVVEYKIANGFFTEKVVLTALEAVNKPLQLGVRHGFESKNWDKIICALYPTRVVDADKSTVFSYSEKDNDRNRSVWDKYQHALYPLTLLEGKNGILLAGSFDLDKFVTISPNMPQGYFPSLQKNPLSVKKGETFEFVYNCRFYPGDRYLLRDVWREYSKNIYSNNPLIKDFVPYKERPYRTYFRGAHVGCTFFMESREARLSPGSNVWWFGWLDWATETYPTSGEWWNNIIRGEWHKVSAKQLKDEVTRLQNNGHKLALYCRQLANLNLKGTKFPASWFRTKAGGSLDIYEGAYRVKISPEMQKELGWKDIPWGTFDFDNPEYLDFYVKQIQDAVTYYDTKAIGWDMAWRSDHPGIFAAQARLYNYLQEKHPGKKVVTNECGGGPTAFYSDMIILENGALGGRNEYTYEFIKAFGNAMVCIERVGLFKGAVILNLTNGKSSWLSEEGLALNKKYLDFILKKRPELLKNRLELARLCHLRMNLFDQSLGAAPAYLDEVSRVPEKMLTMAEDCVAMPLIIKSFVVRLPNGKDRMYPLYTSAWLTEKAARLVVYNDNVKAEKFTIRLQKEYFRNFKWDRNQLAAAEAYMISPERTSIGKPVWQEDGQDIILSGTLPPFTAMYILGDKE
ncbi:MAG: hypothetical protein IJW35_04340 [Lentisphaeria bacterium]|nr:hypothetical protein [Lentisphaeria bacterium]